MSARRKGKPQQRKKIETLEPSQDLLTCGACQSEFLLGNICAFIEHKVKHCKHDKCDAAVAAAADDDDADDDTDGDRATCSGGAGGGAASGDATTPTSADAVVAIINSRRTSIYAPISRRETPELREKLSMPPAWPADAERTAGLLELALTRCTAKTEPPPPPPDTPTPATATTAARPDESSLKKLLNANRIDTGVNTIYSEPIHFVCGICKSVYSSSWFLLQHVQNTHGIKVYAQERGACPTPSPPPLPPLPCGPLVPLQLPPHPLHRSPGRHSPVTAPPFTGPLSPFIFPARPSYVRPPLPSELASPLTPDPFRRHAPPPFIAPPLAAAAAAAAAAAFEPARFSFAPSATFESAHDDYYSQRLRELARPTPRPTTPPPPPPPPPAAAAGAGAEAEAGAAGGLKGEEELKGGGRAKACEFCGKCFQFQSNLIVHRRSHTGEKPYKCGACPHACTQASKLKRHMRTHAKSPAAAFAAAYSADSVGSSGSDSKHSKDDEDEEEEEEEDEEEEMEEDDEEMCDEEMTAVKPAQEQPTDLSQGKKREGDVARGLATDLSVYRAQLESGPPAAAAAAAAAAATMSLLQAQLELPHRASRSTLSEMMANSGLARIPQYKEAFQEALAAAQCGDDDDDMDDMDDDGVDGSEDDAKGGDDETSSNDELAAKCSKPDDCMAAAAAAAAAATLAMLPVGIPPGHPYSPSPAAGIGYSPSAFWFHPPAPGPVDLLGGAGLMRRDAFTLHMPPHVLRENGLSLRPGGGGAGGGKVGLCGGHPAALSPALSPAVSPAPHALLAAAGYSPSGRRRNDTCEFCGKIFKNCSNLTVHRRSHTGEKPYKCGVCNYACAQSSKLTRHMKTHGRLGKDIYCCKFCNMPFSVPGTLEKHMKKCVESHAPWAAAAIQYALPLLGDANGDVVPAHPLLPAPPPLPRSPEALPLLPTPAAVEPKTEPDCSDVGACNSLDGLPPPPQPQPQPLPLPQPQALPQPQPQQQAEMA